MLTADQRTQLLQLYPPLVSLEAAVVDQALSRMRVLPVTAGTPLFHEHQSCEAFPFLLSGSVRVFKSSASGRQLPLYRVHPGDACVVTSGCLLGHRPYNARGVVEADSELVMMPAEDFELLLAQRAFRDYVFGLFGERLQELMQLIDEVAFRKLDQRLAARLLGHGAELKISHQQLADELGSVREMISRLLKGFAEDGLVTLGREQIGIRDAAALRRIAAG